jgi:hypothetical protein
MFKLTAKCIVGAAVIACFLIAGCSDDETPTTPDNNNQTYDIDLADLQALIEDVAPPEYTGPSSAPTEIDSMWLYGQYSLLGKVFGSQDPQSLYTNVNSFKDNMDIITKVAKVDANNNLITGTYVDSSVIEMDGDSVMIHFTATVTALENATAIPADAQGIIGTSVDVDYLISVETVEMPQGNVLMGIKLTDTEQTLLFYDEGMGDPNSSQNRLLYASLNLADSTFVFKGLGYVLHQDARIFSYAFNITSAANSDFSYSMSWYAAGELPDDYLCCILGGGNKNTEFGMSYRQFVPADTNVMDSVNMYDQVFGPDYTEGAGLITDYAEYVDEGLLFLYDVVPQALVTNPWAE